MTLKYIISFPYIFPFTLSDYDANERFTSVQPSLSICLISVKNRKTGANLDSLEDENSI